MLPNIKILHLEPTDVCQAACPQCARETDSAFRKDLKHHLSMGQVLDVFDASRISALDKMFMCGNYGDPAAGKHTLEIYQEFRKINPGIVLGMNTNGALQNTAWWEELASILNQSRDFVVFSIDGLEDTNHLYRKNVDWEKLLQNVSAFIKAGGQAHWDMLVYQHNQHQVDQCQSLAKSLGFRWFRTKVSKRPLLGQLQYPVHWKSTKTTGNIMCHALAESSAYINSQGIYYVCCWLANSTNTVINDINQVQPTWNTNNPHPICAAHCSSQGYSTAFGNQWRQEIEL